MSGLCIVLVFGLYSGVDILAAACSIHIRLPDCFVFVFGRFREVTSEEAPQTQVRTSTLSCFMSVVGYCCRRAVGE